VYAFPQYRLVSSFFTYTEQLLPMSYFMQDVIFNQYNDSRNYAPLFYVPFKVNHIFILDWFTFFAGKDLAVILWNPRNRPLLLSNIIAEPVSSTKLQISTLVRFTKSMNSSTLI